MKDVLEIYKNMWNIIIWSNKRTILNHIHIIDFKILSAYKVYVIYRLLILDIFMKNFWYLKFKSHSQMD